MHPRRWTGALFLVLAVGLAATPVGAQSASVGLLRGPLPPDATVGALRGPLPADATVGALAGPLPAGASTGLLRGPVPTGETIGVFAGPLPAGATAGAFQGSVPPGATVGAFAEPLPPNVSLGPPTPEDIARSLEAQANIRLVDGEYRAGESLLSRSVTLREQTLGPEHPGVADALERHARLLRRWNRSATATDLEDRAKKIREKLEPPVPAE